MTAPTRFLRIPAPSARATVWIHGLVIAILVAIWVWMLAWVVTRPCLGDAGCMSDVLGPMTIATGLPVVGFAAWRLAGQPAPLVLLDAFAVGGLVGLLGAEGMPSPGPLELTLFAPVIAVPLLGLVGLLADLSAQRTERWLAIAGLVAMAALFAVNPVAIGGLVPAVAALAAAARLFRRGS